MFGLTKEMIDVKGGYYETTALMNAARGGHAEIVELLLDNGADADVRNSYGFQAIHYATSRGHLDVAKLIANKHPEVLNSKNRWEQTPLKLARINGQNHTVNWLTREMKVTE